MVGRLCLPAHGPNAGAQRIVTFSRGLPSLLRDAEGTLVVVHTYKGPPRARLETETNPNPNV